MSKHQHFSIRAQLLSASILFFSLFVFTLAYTSYVLYSNNVNEVTNNQIIYSSKQTFKNYESYFDNVIQVSDAIQVHMANADPVTNKAAETQYFDNIMAFKSEILSIALFDTKGYCVVNNTNSTFSESYKDVNWYKAAYENQIIDNFSIIDTYGDKYSFTLSKYISYNNGKNYGILKLDYDFTKIINLIPQNDLGTDGHISIYDENYNVVYSSNRDYVDLEINDIKNIALGNKIVTINHIPFSVVVSTISKTTWKVAIFNNIQSVYDVINRFISIVVISGIAFLVLFAVIMFFVSSSISSPITQLTKEMKQIENLNYENSLSTNLRGSKESVELTKSFQQMMIRIKELANKIILEQQAQRKSELKALQNQINPHFLYNTLDSIVYLIDNNENEKAEKMIIALSKFFRISISQGKTIIPISKEIEHVYNYLLIQKMRFGSTFDFTIDVQENINNYNVPKLILQPIVENAIAHGLQGLETKGEIHIKGYTKDKNIIFEISDNGFGMLPEKIEEIYASFKDLSIHSGVGLQNVYNRIHIYYGEEAHIEIQSDLDKGSNIVIYIPIEGAIKNEEEI